MSETSAAILVVDDNEMNRDMLSRRLERRGYKVSLAEDGRRALYKIAREPFDLVLLDVMMPGLSGVEVLTKLRERFSIGELPVIMVTAKGDSDDLVGAFKLGANDYITKPVDFPVALARVQTQLRLKSLQDELAKAGVAAEAASRAKSEFLASMSHEIRTPLNAVLGYAELLEETGLDEEQAGYVRVLRAGGDALLSLINDILDLSKIEAGGLELESIDFDLSDLVEKTRAIMSVRTDEKGLGLECRIAEDVPTWLAGDPTRLRQIIINLIGNAAKFTESGSVTLRVETDPEGAAPPHLRFSVDDTGIGIPADKLDSVFEKFTQASSDTTRKYGGTGLGLPICKRLAEMMGGRMWVESEAGKGSSFRFTARFAEAATPAPAPRTAPAPAPKAAPALPAGPERKAGGEAGMRILLVDDTAQNRNLVLLYLKKTPHAVDIAENGQVAVDKFKSGGYDLVLMDMEMPVMDGYTATSEIRKLEKERGATPTPVIALTAHAMAEHAKKGLEAGCTAHVEKPVKKTRLLEVVASFSGGAGPRPPVEDGGQMEVGACMNEDAAQDRIVVEVDKDIEELIPEFLELTRKDVVNIAAALEKGDHELARRIGHSVKGASGGYGFDELGRIGARIEQAAKTQDAEAMGVHVREFASYMDRLEVVFK